MMNQSFPMDPNQITVINFRIMDVPALEQMRAQLPLALPVQVLQFVQRHYLLRERRDPVIGELRFLDKLYANEAWHTFRLEEVLGTEEQLRAFCDVCRMRDAWQEKTAPTLRDLTDTCPKYLMRAGIHPFVETLYAGEDTELAAMAGGREPRLSLTLPHGKAALLPLAPPDAPAHAALCCLIPTGNEPFASEITRFLGAHTAEQITPLGTVKKEGVLPHLLTLSGFSLNATALPGYQPLEGPAALLSCGEGCFLFLVPQKHLHALFAHPAPLTHLGNVQNGGKLQVHYAGVVQLSLDLAFLQSMIPFRPEHVQLPVATEEVQERAFVTDRKEILGGIECTAADETTLLQFLKEAASRGADLTRATVTATLETPRARTRESLPAAVSLLLAVHRVTAELTLPAIHQKHVHADVEKPRLCFFLHAPLGAPRAVEDITDYAALRALFWDK